MAEKETMIETQKPTQKNDTVDEEIAEHNVFTHSDEISSESTSNESSISEVISESRTKELEEKTESDIDVESSESTKSNATEKETFSVDELTKQLAEAKFKAEKHWDAVLRQRAETDNVRKRMERELDKVRKYALEKFANELLPVKDSMELGLEAAEKPETDVKAVREGLALTLKMLTDALEKFGIVEVNPQNEKFNPEFHEAMTLQVVPNVPDNTVIYVHQKGYQLNKRLLRPARVIVSKSPEK